MTSRLRFHILAVLPLFAADTAQQPHSVEAQSASVKFLATTNLSAVSIHGQSNELKAHAMVSHENGQLLLENLEASVDPKSINTGMSMRDHHMREKIFSDGSSNFPELRFHSSRALCADPAKGKESICQVEGTFSLRGKSKPFALPLRIKSDANRYRLSAEGQLKLTDYGITPPCQLGVCVTDAVKIKIDMLAEERQAISKASLESGGK